jgi:hypothetical protein
MMDKKMAHWIRKPEASSEGHMLCSSPAVGLQTGYSVPLSICRIRGRFLLTITSYGSMFRMKTLAHQEKNFNNY